MDKLELKGLTALDLFAGAGGLSLAGYNLGLDILAAVELDNDACATYKHNIIDNRQQPVELYNNDILDLTPESILNDLNLVSGELDFLMGGPPCQGFSTHRINGAGVNDPRNELLIRYFDFVKTFMPKVFLVENVPGLLWKRHELYLQKFKKLSHVNGYKLYDPIKINAKNYGVPQSRQRVFILGFREDVKVGNIKWPPRQTHFQPGKGTPEWLTASTVFETPSKSVHKRIKDQIGSKLADPLNYGNIILTSDKDHSAIHMNHTPPLVDRFSQTPINGDRSDIAFRLPCHSKGYVGHLDVYGRVRLAQPGPTITTGCFNPSKGRFLHPWRNHGITIRHAARFQSFPDDYIFSGGMTSQGKQVGNAVPVKLAETIISSALNYAVAESKKSRRFA